MKQYILRKWHLIDSRIGLPATEPASASKEGASTVGGAGGCFFLLFLLHPLGMGPGPARRRLVRHLGVGGRYPNVWQTEITAEAARAEQSVRTGNVGTYKGVCRVNRMNRIIRQGASLMNRLLYSGGINFMN